MARRKDCYTENEKLQLVTVVCEKLASSDMSIDDICVMSKGILPAASTLRLWGIQNAELSSMFSRAMVQRADYLVEPLISIVDNDPDAAKARNRMQCRQWIAGKLNPAKYSDKLNIGLNATVTVQDDPASLKSALALYHILQSLQSKAASAGEVIELPTIEHVDNSK